MALAPPLLAPLPAVDEAVSFGKPWSPASKYDMLVDSDQENTPQGNGPMAHSDAKPPIYPFAPAAKTSPRRLSPGQNPNGTFPANVFPKQQLTGFRTSNSLSSSPRDPVGNGHVSNGHSPRRPNGHGPSPLTANGHSHRRPNGHGPVTPSPHIHDISEVLPVVSPPLASAQPAHARLPTNHPFGGNVAALNVPSPIPSPNAVNGVEIPRLPIHRLNGVWRDSREMLEEVSSDQLAGIAQQAAAEEERERQRFVEQMTPRRARFARPPVVEVEDNDDDDRDRDRDRDRARDRARDRDDERFVAEMITPKEEKKDATAEEQLVKTPMAHLAQVAAGQGQTLHTPEASASLEFVPIPSLGPPPPPLPALSPALPMWPQPGFPLEFSGPSIAGPLDGATAGQFVFMAPPNPWQPEPVPVPFSRGNGDNVETPRSKRTLRRNMRQSSFRRVSDLVKDAADADVSSTEEGTFMTIGSS